MSILIRKCVTQLLKIFTSFMYFYFFNMNNVSYLNNNVTLSKENTHKFEQ